jgi:uncharacterized cupredoxin-like copper-binding protein
MTRPLLLIPVVVLLAGCGGGGGSNESENTGAVVQTIQISEKEFSLNPSTVDVSKTGTYEFEVTNDGQITHALNIEESGGAETESGNVEPGQTKTVRFTFSKDGSYEMYCPIDGHRDQGMEGTITVGSAAGGAGQTTTGETETENEMTTGQTTTSSGPGY